MKKGPQCLPGMGLRSEHYSYLEERPQTNLKWFEALTENYMDTKGRPFEILKLIRKDYHVALHGVSMNLASFNGPTESYLKRLKALIHQVEPFIISDHLCWTGLTNNNIHDLLPFPYTKEALEIVSQNVDRVQNYLGRRIAIENVSTYMTFRSSEMMEWDFLKELCLKTGAGVLLDVNNIYVSATNHGFDPMEFIRSIPTEMIDQIHLGGYTDLGKILFDTHSNPVHDPVWPLFKEAISKKPNIPFMMEWDEDVPEFAVVEQEVLKAKEIWKEVYQPPMQLELAL